jgi:hypothetical protein
MKSIEHGPAALFYAGWLLPLRYANLRRGVNYLSHGSPRQSYWGAVTSRTGGMEQLSGESSDTLALLELLGRYWAQRDEADLLQLLPHLMQLHRQLAGETKRADTVEPQLTEFTYPVW